MKHANVYLEVIYHIKSNILLFPDQDGSNINNSQSFSQLTANQVIDL